MRGAERTPWEASSRSTVDSPQSIRKQVYSPQSRVNSRNSKPSTHCAAYVSTRRCHVDSVASLVRWCEENRGSAACYAQRRKVAKQTKEFWLSDLCALAPLRDGFSFSYSFAGFPSHQAAQPQRPASSDFLHLRGKT